MSSAVRSWGEAGFFEGGDLASFVDDLVQADQQALIENWVGVKNRRVLHADECESAIGVDRNRCGSLAAERGRSRRCLAKEKVELTSELRALLAVSAGDAVEESSGVLLSSRQG